MRAAIVTGATSGMGREMGRILLAECQSNSQQMYDEIWLLGRRRERLQAWEKKYPGVTFRLLPLDITKEADRDTFAALLENEQPQIEVFVHAAGIGVMGTIEEISQADQEEMVELNIKSTVSLTKSILPFMKSGGQMIYFASAAAFLPQPGFAVYAASKSFVVSYVRALRAESRPRNLRITAVCPGAVRTEFFDRATQLHDVPAYKKLVMAKPKRVAQKAWKDNKCGREMSVYGLPMQGFHLLTKLLPHRLFLHFLK